MVITLSGTVVVLMTAIMSGDLQTNHCVTDASKNVHEPKIHEIRKNQVPRVLRNGLLNVQVLVNVN